MAINTSTITQLISDFRALSQKDSISPESLGSLLQKIVDLIRASVNEDEIAEIINALNAVPNVLTSIEQGSPNDTNVLMNVSTSNLVTGTLTSETDKTFITKATTEQAGAMTAQHVKDLDSLKSNVSSLISAQQTHSSKIQSLEQSSILTQDSVLVLKDNLKKSNDSINGIQTTVSDHSEKLTRLDDVTTFCSESVANLTEELTVANDSINLINAEMSFPKLKAVVKNGVLYIVNGKYYIDQGLSAHVFRKTTRRNKFAINKYPEQKRGSIDKGWHEIGRLDNNVRIDANGAVSFRASKLYLWHYGADESQEFTCEPNFLVGFETNEATDVNQHVPWGKKMVKLGNEQGKFFMRRFRFALGFGNEHKGKFTKALLPTDLKSELVEFSIIFDPKTKKFSFNV